MAEKKSTYNERHNRYTQEYIHKKYDQIVLRLPKEGKEGVITRDIIIDQHLLSLNLTIYVIQIQNSFYPFHYHVFANHNRLRL